MAAQVSLCAGDIVFLPKYYQDPPGTWHGKYLVILCTDRSGDYIFRLLTSRHGNAAQPCDHEAAYPTFYLGVLGGPLTANSAVDMRPQPSEFDAQALHSLISSGGASRVAAIAGKVLCDALDCVAQAEDTTAGHATLIRDQMAALKC